jgi:multisubunit Na+/H+ antiporter MnhB subunit
VPLLVIIAAYLLWLGAFAPGGAFQAGAVLAAAGVLLLLVERRPKADLPPVVIRSLLAVGVVAFALTGLVLAVAGDGMLTLPRDSAGALILAIETLATLAIAVTLIALFAGLAASED